MDRTIIRDAAARKARQLEELLEGEVRAANSRLEAARKTRAHVESGAPLGRCPLPHGDFSDRPARLSAALDALIQLGFDAEEGR